jgi:uncharacterized protein YjcR
MPGSKFQETSELLANLESSHSADKLKAMYSSKQRSDERVGSNQDITSMLANANKDGAKSGRPPVNANAKAKGPFNADMTSMLMESETKRYVNEYKNQIDLLRMIVYNLDNKIQRLTTYEGEALLLRDEVEKSNSAREELRKSLLETTQDLREESAKFNNVIYELESHNKDILAS